jgi:hypothetical protein
MGRLLRGGLFVLMLMFSMGLLKIRLCIFNYTLYLFGKCVFSDFS